MRKIAIAIGIGAAMALSACGSSESGTIDIGGDEGTYTVDSDGDGYSIQASTEDGEFSLNTGDDLDVDMPDGFTLYPGASVTSDMTLDQDDGGSVITMESDASADDVLSYYRSEAEAAGIEIKVEMDVRGMKVLAGEDADGASFTVRAGAGDDGGTTTTLMVAN